jgi:hypothetical protein
MASDGKGNLCLYCFNEMPMGLTGFKVCPKCYFFNNHKRTKVPDVTYGRKRTQDRQG